MPSIRNAAVVILVTRATCVMETELEKVIAASPIANIIMAMSTSSSVNPLSELPHIKL